MLFQTITRKSHRILNRYFLFDSSGDYKNTVLLAGIGRSGSTWLLNILNYQNRYRIIFEPFYPERVEEASPFAYPQYLRADKATSKYYLSAEHILSGRVRNPWTDRYNRQWVPKRRLIKSIRANLFLKWLYENFPGIPIVLLMRHPCAVVHSWLESGFGDGIAAQQRILAQQGLVDDFPGAFWRSYKNAKNAFERLIHFWCIYYYVPLKQFAPNEIHITFYERLVERPEDEVKRLFSFLGETYDERSLSSFHKPSHTTRKDSIVRNGEANINYWKQHFSATQIHLANETLNMFGLDMIYSENSMPDIQNVNKIMRVGNQ